MELKDFIRDTLFEVAMGVREANAKLGDVENGTSELFKLRRNVGNNEAAANIEFDVALVISKKQKDKAGFFMTLATIGGGASTQKDAGNEHTHRIKFEVNVAENWR